MGKSRRQNTNKESHRDETNKLKDIIRKQQKEIQSLRKELNRKLGSMTIRFEEKNQNPEERPQQKVFCDKCKGTEFCRISLGIKTLVKCMTCNATKTEKAKG